MSSAFQNAFQIQPIYTTVVLVALSAVIVLRKNATVRVLDILVPIMAAYTFVWDLGDVGVGLMTVFNIIVIIPMSKQALESLQDYEGKMKAGQDK